MKWIEHCEAHYLINLDHVNFIKISNDKRSIIAYFSSSEPSEEKFTLFQGEEEECFVFFEKISCHLNSGKIDVT